jgi:TRAP-type uncharacterized transport system substrate-binding protein
MSMPGSSLSISLRMFCPLTFATEGMAIPFHPGAAQYFAENGITVDTGA